jgi:hypothetical protein
MKRHFITAGLLLVALVFYLLGYSGTSGLMFAVGAVFEIWFWLRVL